MPRVTIRTEHERPGLVAAALAPDNTDEMSTDVGDCAVVTTIERDSTSSLRATADDYVANLTVAHRMTDTTTQS